MRYMAGPGGSRPGNRAGPRLMQKTTEDPWRESRLAPNGFEPTGTPEHAGRAHGRPAFNCLTRQGDDGREGRDRGKRSCRSGQRRDAVLPVGPAEGCGPAGRDSGGRRRGGGRNRPVPAAGRGPAGCPVRTASRPCGSCGFPVSAPVSGSFRFRCPAFRRNEGALSCSRHRDRFPVRIPPSSSSRPRALRCAAHRLPVCFSLRFPVSCDPREFASGGDVACPAGLPRPRERA